MGLPHLAPFAVAMERTGAADVSRKRSRLLAAVGAGVLLVVALTAAIGVAGGLPSGFFQVAVRR